MPFMKNRDNYVSSKHSLMGMLSKNQEIIEEGLSIRRNKNKVMAFSAEEAALLKGIYSSVQIGYIPDRKIFKKDLMAAASSKTIDCSFSYKGTCVISYLIEDSLYSFPGKENSEMRESVNSLSKRIVEVPGEDVEDVIGVVKTIVDKWDQVQGPKYGWQRHSGYDKNFFATEYYQEEKQNLQTLFFMDKETREYVGYSVISKDNVWPGDMNKDACLFPYVIRKYDPVGPYRNLCMYIDVMSFRKFREEMAKNIWINWGASSGNILNYKRNKMKRFFDEEYEVWFGKVT